MRKTALFLLTLCCLTLSAATLPKTSTAEAPVWYFIKFMNGGAVLEAKTSGAQVLTAGQSGSDAQIWRVEGSSSAGYKFVSRSGMTLYTDNTNTNGMFYAATSPSSNTSFTIKACTLSGYAEGFTISPKANSGVYMNQWGGAGAGKQLGLWNAVDNNCPLQFVSEEEFLAELEKAKLPLIPMPTSLTIGEGGVKMHDITTVAYPSDGYRLLAQQYAEMLGKISGQTLTTKLASGATPAAGTITLAISTTGEASEGYQMEVSKTAVTVTATSAHGFFNALQTLRQLYYYARRNADATVPCLSINDKPLFEYRGFMLDIARHYFDKEEVKKLLDVMALYKINKFHWHLTDDQGWRIEIPEYPLLTEVGAIRSSSNTKTNPRFFDDTEYGRGMYYTLADLSEIVEYASKLHIDIMPEIDLPGHMVAAITSYPDEFACAKTGIDDENKNGYTVRIKEGISKDVLNVAKPEVMTFLKCVLSHMAEVFPYPVFHIGGDECPTDAWQQRVNAKDKQFTEWMAANNLSSVNDIQPWLVNELGQWLRTEYRKEVVCWNELTNHWNSKYKTQPIIMCYSDYGHNAMKAATNLGMRTIYTGCWPLYLDMYQTYDSNYNAATSHNFDDPYTGGYGNNTLMAVYNAAPLSNIAGKENLCMGVGANLWTETVNTNEEAEHQYFPRMLALAEVGWLPQDKKSWASFQRRVQSHFDILDEFGVNYATYDKEPDPTPDLAGYHDMVEARRLLQDAHPDEVGYPSAGTYETLRNALTAYETNNASEAALQALTKAITTFKAAPVTQPEEGKTYRIVSASVAWGRDYAGSAMYITSDKKIRFHYTQQTEPEELFQFVPLATGGYRLMTRIGNYRVNYGTIDAKATATNSGTTTRVDAATVGSTNPSYYDYIPGVVTISAKSGYSANGNTCKRLNAQNDGYVYAKADATVGHTGSWRIVEVTDFAAELRALVDKCRRLGILTDEIVTPATTDLEQGIITQNQYEAYVALYAAHIGMAYTPTGIAHISDAPTTTSATYDLQGKKTSAPLKGGVYITDSKKTLQ